MRSSDRDGRKSARHGSSVLSGFSRPVVECVPTVPNARSDAGGECTQSRTGSYSTAVLLLRNFSRSLIPSLVDVRDGAHGQFSSSSLVPPRPPPLV